MNADPVLRPDDATPITIDAPQTLRLPAGAAVFAVRGEAWITLEGNPDDVILAAGARFNVPSRAPMVVSATRGRVDLFLVRPAVARLHPSCSLHDLARMRAAQLRSVELARLADALVHRVRWWLARLRPLVAVRPRLPTH